MTTGRDPWNKGLNKDTDQRVAKNGMNTGKRIKGRVPWNKGLNKDTDIRLAKAGEKLSKVNKGRPAVNKGKPSLNRGKSYEELYGAQKASELKEKRRKKMQDRWDKKKLDQFYSDK